MRIFYLLVALFTGLWGPSAQAQGRAIGQWRSHYPYNVVRGIATDGTRVWAASDQGFFFYNSTNGEFTTHSKVDGMSDAGTERIGYDATTETVIITYSSGNIDLYRNGSFYNIPSLRLRPSNGSKSVNDVFTHQGVAYLSTELGILVLDLERQEVRETYVFAAGSTLYGARALRIYNDSFYAATSNGLYRAPRQAANLQDFSSWQQVLPGNVGMLAAASGYVYALTPSGVVRTTGGTSDTVYRSPWVVDVAPALSGIVVAERRQQGIYLLGKQYVLAPNGLVTDSFYSGYPNQVRVLADGSYMVADGWRGLLRRQSGLEGAILAPSGPAFPYAYSINANQGNVAVLHGGFNRLYVPRGVLSKISYYDLSTDRWRIEEPFGNAVRDLMDAETTAEGTWYVAMQGGLFLKKPDGTVENAGAGVLEPFFDDPSGQGAVSLTKDLDGNLIVSQYKALAHELSVRTPAGRWVKWSANGSAFVGGLPRTAAGLLVDDYNQKWWFQPRGGGVFVYDDNHTPENLADDRNIHLGTGSKNGGLPSAAVLSMAKDLEGAIWIGTEDGLAIVSCPGNVMDRSCEAVQPPVKYDQFAGLLFDKEQVQTIAVDGGNRKWVGTNNGVWLLSPDGQQILERFTAENSPLPVNTIQHIAIDPGTGDVYISTTEGLVSYRGSATTGEETSQTIGVFPNPVRSGYNGTIAFRNLPTDADVRITDISGQLVYRTRAAGGQATWNGQDYTGKRPATGVYLVFVTSKDGTITSKGKLVFAE